MADHIKSERHYTEAELKAARRLTRVRGLSIEPPKEGQGALYFATGKYYPELLDKLAKDYERAAEDAKLVAEALRREFERWPEK